MKINQKEPFVHNQIPTKMKKNIVSILILFLHYGLSAQTPETYQDLKFLPGDFGYYVINQSFLKKQTFRFDTMCIRSCAFVSFKVRGDGYIDSIVCNSTTPKMLADLFIEAIASSAKEWTTDLINKKEVSQRFILPINYLLQNQCGALKDNTQESIRRMLEFTDTLKFKNAPPFITNNLNMVNCILLPPAEYFMVH